MNLNIKANLNKIQKYLKIRRFFLRVPLIETNTSIYYLVKKSCKNDNRSVKISGFVKCSVEKASKTVGYIPERNLVWKAWRVQELWLSGYLKHGITKYAQAHFSPFLKIRFHHFSFISSLIVNSPTFEKFACPTFVIYYRTTTNHLTEYLHIVKVSIFNASYSSLE